MNTTLTKIPQRFYDDHVDRDLPAPEVMKANATHYWIDGTSEHLGELLNDAEYYAPPADWLPEYFGLTRSAAATARAIHKHTGGTP